MSPDKNLLLVVLKVPYHSLEDSYVKHRNSFMKEVSAV